MTDNTTDTLGDIKDLEAFEVEFYGKEKPEVEEAEEEIEDSETELETEEDEDAEAEDETEAEDEDQEDEDEEEPIKEEPKSEKKGRKSAKERIDELTAEKYEARREVENLRRELEVLRVHPKEEVKPSVQALSETLPPEAPKPDALKADGEPVYALGEFDPQFIRDITRFTIEQEMKEVHKKQELEAQARQVQAQQAALQQTWNENLSEVEKELPDIREKLQSMSTVFQNVDPNYGEYLAGVIMTCENGPEIMYYLADNIGEAQKIVASGPAAATLAIGRLEARLEGSSGKEEEKRNTKKVSEAPSPPTSRVRGSGGKFSVAGDTNDLDAFERVFFKRPTKSRPF